jgi:hypothetical protein
MKIKPTLILIISSLLVSCRPDSGSAKTEQEMDALLSDFTVQWKADSLGRNGFRMNNYSRDTINKTCLIKGLNFEGHNEEQIVKWLGQPSYKGRHKEDNGLIMNYPIRQDTSDPDMTLLIYFDKDDKVSFIMEKSGMPK